MNFVAICHTTKFLVEILIQQPTPIPTSSTVFRNGERRSSHTKAKHLTRLDNRRNVFVIQAPSTGLKHNRGIPHFINCTFVKQFCTCLKNVYKNSLLLTTLFKLPIQVYFIKNNYLSLRKHVRRDCKRATKCKKSTKEVYLLYDFKRGCP